MRKIVLREAPENYSMTHNPAQLFLSLAKKSPFHQQSGCEADASIVMGVMFRISSLQAFNKAVHSKLVSPKNRL
jgi:hypothetical protein